MVHPLVLCLLLLLVLTRADVDISLSEEEEENTEYGTPSTPKTVETIHYYTPHEIDVSEVRTTQELFTLLKKMKFGAADFPSI